MQQKLELANKHFGSWTPLEIVGKTNGRKNIWKCQCNCGKVRNIVASKILNFTDNTCCKDCKILNNNATEAQKYLVHVKSRAKSKKIDFTLNDEHLYKMLSNQNDSCYFSGVNINFNDSTASLDRLDPLIGYVHDNVVLVHKDVNIMKGLLSPEYFIYLCGKISCFDRNYPIFTRNLIINKDKRFRGIGELTHTYFQSLKYNAVNKKNNRHFDITIEDIWWKYLEQGGLCALSGLAIEFNPFFSRDYGNQSASVDRVDSSVGYTKDNIQIVHKNVNWMKNVFTQDYFIETCKKIHFNKHQELAKAWNNGN